MSLTRDEWHALGAPIEEDLPLQSHIDPSWRRPIRHAIYNWITNEEQTDLYAIDLRGTDLSEPDPWGNTGFYTTIDGYYNHERHAPATGRTRYLIEDLLDLQPTPTLHSLWPTNVH